MNNTTSLYKHPHPFREIVRRYRACHDEKDFYWSVFASMALFFVSVVVNYYAGAYATDRVSNSVTDIVLSNTPVFDVDGLFVYGAIVLIGYVGVLCVTHPKCIPLTLYSLALFYFIRGGFVSLTHIGPFPEHTPIHFTTNIGIYFSKMFFGDDLFFSGHTGAPFLMALVYWKQKFLRSIFLLWSLFFAAVVLLGHIHYSIDVAAAFFITYSIFHLVMYFFPHAKSVFDASFAEDHS